MMTGHEPELWPFPIGTPGQLTDEQRERVAFFTEANSLRYGPRRYADYEFYLESETRSVWLIARGGAGRPLRRHWEVQLFGGPGRAVACLVNNFRCASFAVFAWLRGENAPSAFAAAGDSVIRGGLDATPAGAAG